MRVILTKPCLSEMLLVSFSLWKETTFCIHCSPVVGLAGWMYIRFGISGSALPATIHRLKRGGGRSTHMSNRVEWRATAAAAAAASNGSGIKIGMLANQRLFDLIDPPSLARSFGLR